MIGKRLREARLKKDITQKSLADQLGIEGIGSPSRIASYESDRHEPPVNITRAIAKILDVPEYYFYIEDDAEADALLIRFNNKKSKSNNKNQMIEDIKQALDQLKI